MAFLGYCHHARTVEYYQQQCPEFCRACQCSVQISSGNPCRGRPTAVRPLQVQSAEDEVAFLKTRAGDMAGQHAAALQAKREVRRPGRKGF